MYPISYSCNNNDGSKLKHSTIQPLSILTVVLPNFLLSLIYLPHFPVVHLNNLKLTYDFTQNSKCRVQNPRRELNN